MTKKQKNALARIIVAAALAIALHFAPIEGIWLLFLYLVPYLIAGYDVLRKAFLGIRGGQVFDENFLMAVATVGALALGSYGEGVEVMVFYQIGELFQSYAVGRSRRSITQLMDIRPDSANIERDGEIEEVDPDDVAIGDIIVIRPGERVPLDGEVIEGRSALNTSALTGESLPREVNPGDEIISGCVNENGLLRVRVTKSFGDSTVSRILDLVENSSLKKAKAENFITKFARWYTPAVCLGALLLAVIPPLFLGQWLTWIRRALTFLVISCPCALVISSPLSFVGGIGGASRAGILVKGGNYLEALASTRTVVFDKTGTLTRGVFAVSEALPEKGVGAEALLETAALAEIYSSHPISRSLREAVSVPLDANRVDEVREIAGQGLTARVDDRIVAAGNAKLMNHLKIAFTPCDRPGTVVYVAEGSRFIGSVVISDQVKPTARRAVDALRAQGIRTVMLTGDAENVAQAVGAELGIDYVRAELLPADKVKNVEELLRTQRPGEKLAFVGDGINDAPVLSRADIGIAMGGIGSDAAIEAADIVLMDDDPAKISLAMRISRKCLAIVRENIVFALGVKAICLALGALGVAGMQAAIFADVGVMVLAVLNATRTLVPVKAGA